MALKIWLPLTQDLRNLGTENLPPYSYSNSISFNSDGKISEKAFRGGCGWHLTNDILDNKWTVSVWAKRNSAFASSNNLIFCKNTSAANDSQIYLSIINGTTLNLGINSSTYAFQKSYTFNLDTWYHIVATYDGANASLYINGVLAGTMAFSSTKTNALNVFINCRSTNSGGTSIGSINDYSLNDFRLYDEALSPTEIKEISRGLVRHYKLDDLYNSENKNLFRDTYMAINYSFVSNSSTDWTKYFRYYNGSTSKHTIVNGEDTILLNVAQNMGIAFQRKATDIELDSNSYYTVSCEAKTTKVNGQLCMGTSYYNTSNAWVWRGGSNPKNFNAINTWQKFYWTFKPDADIQYIMYCFTMVGTSGSTDTFSIKNCKLEKGKVATKWNFNPEDKEYNILGYNSNSIIDNSGINCNNGTITGTLTTSIDSGRYSNSLVFSGSQRIEADSLPSETKSISFWVKTTYNSASSSYKIIFVDKNTGLACGFFKSGFITYCGNAAGGAGSTIVFEEKYVANQWNHVAIIKTGTNTRTVYINGQTVNNSTNNYWAASLDKIIFGCRYSSAYQYYFTGQLSDFRAYATQLSEADILDLYQMGAKIDLKNKFHTYELVEDSSTIKINKKGQLQINELNETTGINFDSTKNLNANELIEI